VNLSRPSALRAAAGAAVCAAIVAVAACADSTTTGPTGLAPVAHTPSPTVLEVD
jgi:hypothetical protein